MAGLGLDCDWVVTGSDLNLIGVWFECGQVWSKPFGCSLGLGWVWNGCDPILVGVRLDCGSGLV